MITREDLQNLKAELLTELKSFLSKTKPSKDSPWLRSAQVREMLMISPGTLQNLRIHNHLRYTKIGGTFYYKYEDIVEMLSNDSTKRLQV